MKRRNLAGTTALILSFFLGFSHSALLGQSPPDSGGPTPPPPVNISGKVISYSGDSIVVEFVDSSNTTLNIKVYIDTGTKIYDKNMNEVPLSNIPLQSMVNVSGEKQADGSIRAFVIQEFSDQPPPGPVPQPGDKFQFGGQIAAIGQNFIVVSWQNPETQESGQDTIPFDASTTIKDPAGNTATLEVGKFVSGEIEIQPDGKPKAISIIVSSGQPGPQPGDKFQFGGQIAAIGQNFIVVSWENPDSGKSGQDTIPFDASTTIKDPAGNTVALEVGKFVSGEIEIQPDGKPKAISIIVSSGQPGPQPGDTVRVGGEVVFVSADSIVLKWHDQTTGDSGVVTVLIDASTAIRDKDGNSAAIAVGNFVDGLAIAQPDGKPKAISLIVSSTPPQPGPKPGDQFTIGGDIRSFTASEIITGWHNPETGESGQDTIFYDAATTIRDEAGNTATLEVGKIIEATVVVQSDWTRKAISIIVSSVQPGPQPGDTVRVGGEVVFVSADSIVLKWQDQTTGDSGVVTVLIDASTAIRDKDGNSATIAAGNFVDGLAVVQNDGRFKATSLNVFTELKPPVEFAGQIITVGQDYLEVLVTKNDDSQDTVKVNIDIKTRLLDENDNTIPLSSFAVGDFVKVGGKFNPDSTLTADKVARFVPGPGEEGVWIAGTVSAVGADELTIIHLVDDLSRSDTITVKVTAETAFEDDADQVHGLADLKIGDLVLVRMVKDQNNVETAVTVVKGGAPGSAIDFTAEIKVIQGNVLIAEIGPPDAPFPFQLVINVSGTTVLKDLDGQTISLGDFHTGDSIDVEGVISQDGKAVEASTITLGAAGPGPGPGPGPQEFSFQAKIISVGQNYILIEHQGADSTVLDTTRLEVSGQTVIRDESGALIGLSDLKAGDNIQGRLRIETDQTVSALEVSRVGPVQKPGDPVAFNAIIKTISTGTITVETAAPQVPSKVITVNLTGATKILDYANNPLVLSDLTVGDIVDIAGKIAADGVAVDADTIILRWGSLREVWGTVIKLTAGGFDLETRDSTNKTILLKVTIGLATQIVSLQTGQALTVADILKGLQVSVRGKVSQDTLMQAQVVRVPPPPRVMIGGRVDTLVAGGFVTEVKQPNTDVFVKVTVTTGGATAWLFDKDGAISPATSADLKVNAFARVFGISTGAASVLADTVWIIQSQELEVATYTIYNGKVSGSTFSFNFNANEPYPADPKVEVTVSMKISPDYKKLTGAASFPDGTVDSLELNKITGTANSLTGSWTGVDAEGVRIVAELTMSGSTVIGKVTRGGVPEGGEGKGVGDSLTVQGKVTAVSAGSSTLVVNVVDQAGQEIPVPVLVTTKTKFLNSQGQTVSIKLDSLLSRKVRVSGIIQPDFSLLANTITDLTVAPGGSSANLPTISQGTWNSGTQAFSFSLAASKFDSSASGSLSFSTQISQDGNSLSGAGTIAALLSAASGQDLAAGSIYQLAAQRVSGASGPDGKWAGNVSLIVSGRTKVWSLLMELTLQGSSVSGSYDLGAAHYLEAVTTQNRPPEIQPFAEYRDIPEKSTLVVPIVATDPENNPITLSIPNQSRTWITLTDNKNGTGSLSLNIPDLPSSIKEIIIAVEATDSQGAKGARNLVIQVKQVNNAPVLPVLTVTPRLTVGKAFSITLPASDPDGDKLTFTATNLPSFLTLAANVISGTPSAGSAGNYTFSLTANDGNGGQVSQNYPLIVEDVNHKPVLDKVPTQKVQVGGTLSFTLHGVDPDQGDVLTYSAEDQAKGIIPPSGLTLNASTGAVSWTPSAGQEGTHLISFWVFDVQKLSDKIFVTVVVGDTTKLPPTLDPISPVTVSQGQSVKIKLSGKSSSGKPLSFFARNLPKGAAFTAQTQEINWTPDYSQSGQFTMTAGVTDGSFVSEQDVKVTVNKVPQIPSFSKLNNVTANEGTRIEFTVVGTYPDGRRVVFNQPAGLPANSYFNLVSGKFTWLAGFDQAGVYNLAFPVTAEDGKVYSASNKVTVNNVNRAPYFKTLGSAVVVDSSQSFSTTIEALDPDAGDVVTLTASGLPAGVTFTAGIPSTLGGAPTVAGNYAVTVKASDQAGASVTRVITVTVRGAQTNLPPVVSALSDVNLSEGDTITVNITVTDPEGAEPTLFISPTPDFGNLAGQGNTFTLTLTPDYKDAGTYGISVLASDGSNTVSAFFTLTVSNTDGPPKITLPSAAWSMAEGDTLAFTVTASDIEGSRLDPLAVSLPPDVSYNPSTGLFYWIIDYDQAGQYQVTFMAGDGVNTTSEEVSILVEDTNRNPFIAPIANQLVTFGQTISCQITASDPDGNPVTLSIDWAQTPYRDAVTIVNNVLNFNTALLASDVPIPWASIGISASDGQGGSARSTIYFKIIREEEKDVTGLDPGGAPFLHQFTGTGLNIQMSNKGTGLPSGKIKGQEVSGTLDASQTNQALLASAEFKYSYLAKSKDKVQVHTFLSATGDLGGDVYTIRRGWGLDLTSAFTANLPTLDLTIALTYQERDIPATDIPEFDESKIGMFGLRTDSEFVLVPSVLDTAANQATATIRADSAALFIGFTLGVILDLDEPLIMSTTQLQNTTNEMGPYTVETIIVEKYMSGLPKLYYALEGGQYQALSMSPTGALNRFSAKIPGQTEGKTVLYYIEVSDSLHTVTDPVNAPDNVTYRFTILYDGIAGFMEGDLNNSGKVDIFDLLELLKVMGKSPQDNPAADVDGNGKVNIFDVLELLKKF